jgi:5-methylcytosine-specific restriction protein A
VYVTRRWRRLRQRKLEANPLCECAECARLRRRRVAEQVDHIVPITEGGDPWAWANLQSLSASCHSRKTRRDQGWATRVGADPDTGEPLDPGHWWHDA